MRYLLLIVTLFSTISLYANSQLKFEKDWLKKGEELTYKATWGFLTIGTATTKIHKDLYKVGSNVCYKIEINGQTNGLAKLFYVQDKWISHIDTASFTSHLSYRRIREGKYELDEQVRFDHSAKKAKVEVLDKNTKQYKLKDVYDTPDMIRDVVAGFMIVQLVDLSKYKKGERFSVNGFYKDEGYSIDIRYIGREMVNSDKGKIACYKVMPVLPVNNVFKGSDAIEVWFSEKTHNIVRISAKMFVGHIIVELKDN